MNINFSGKNIKISAQTNSISSVHHLNVKSIHLNSPAQIAFVERTRTKNSLLSLFCDYIFIHLEFEPDHNGNQFILQKGLEKNVRNYYSQIDFDYFKVDL